jgi:MoxR-like ATPase
MPQYLTWEVIEAIERGAYRVLLYGPPGTGKTRSAYNAASALKKSLYNVTLSDETPAAELRGHYVPQGTKWNWMDGPAVRAFREGAVLCLDEIDKASQDCLDFLHGLLNDLEMARLTLPTGEIVTPDPGFQVIATMNGDIQDLQPSLQDRFSIAIEVDTPHPEAVSSLPEDLQAAAKNVESYEAAQRPATIRRWAAFHTLRELPEVGPENAAKAVFAHRSKELMDAIGFR